MLGAAAAVACHRPCTGTFASLMPSSPPDPAISFLPTTSPTTPTTPALPPFRQANDISERDKRSTISPEHVIKALEELEFGAQYVEMARAGGWQCCLRTRASNHHAAVLGVAGGLGLHASGSWVGLGCVHWEPQHAAVGLCDVRTGRTIAGQRVSLQCSPATIAWHSLRALSTSTG